MRYSILFSFVCLSYLSLVIAQQEGELVLNPVTQDVINQVKQFSAKYTYSTVLPSLGDNGKPASVALWWTPDVASNSLKIGLMTGESAFIGFGFNQFQAMYGTTAAITANNAVQLYNLGGYDPSVITLVANQTNLIQDITITALNSWLFSEYTWYVQDYKITDDLNFLWSSRNGYISEVKIVHDNHGGGLMNFANPTGIKPIQIVDCGFGSVVGSYFPFIGEPNSNCTCIPFFTAESRCSASNMSFNHTFKDQSDSMIATMYWNFDVKTNILEAVVQSVSGIGTGWTGIAFSQADGTMGPADALIFPDNKKNLVPLYLVTAGQYDPDASYKLLKNMTFPGVTNLFYFQRNLSATATIAITDYTSVPMIAATLTTPGLDYPTPHNKQSFGADLINLAAGGSKPAPFVWSKYVTHGLIMWISWAIIIPCGFLWARFIKGYPNDKSALWFEGHRTLMSIGFILVIVSGVYVIGLVNDHLNSTHKILGATVLACALYQVMSAVMRPHADPTNPSPQRLVFEWTHHIIGRSTIIISWVTIGYGLMLVHGISMSVVWGHVALSVIWLVAAFVLEIRKCINARRLREYENLNRR